MNNREFENITAVTLILNFFIVVGAGHGIACLGLIEIFWFPYFNSEYFTFSLFASYDNSLGAACFFSLIGQLLLLFSLFVKREKLIIRAIIIGLIFMSVGFTYLMHGLFINDQSARVSVLTGIPFLIASLIFILKLKFFFTEPPVP